MAENQPVLDMTLLDFLERHFRTKPRIASGSANTLTFYRVELNNFRKYFSKWLGDTGQPPREPCLADLTKLHIEGAMAYQLNRGRGRPTANKVRRAINALWNYASAELGIQPPPRTERYKEPKHEPTCWSMDELGRLMDSAGRLTGRVGPHAKSEWFLALLWTVYNSGLRISAAMAVRWDWLDLHEGKLIVEPEYTDEHGTRQRVQKDDEGQTVTLLPETCEAIARISNPKLGGLFAHWPYDRGVVQWPALNRVLRQCIVDAGLRTDVGRKDYWHKLRRVFATYITIESDIETARDMLGHYSIDVTWRYVDKSKLNRKSQADLLPRPQPNRLRVFSGA